MSASRRQTLLSWRGGAFHEHAREIARETPVAFTYNRLSHAVMMATPADLEDFATGFSLNERIIDSPAELEELEIFRGPESSGGIELRAWIADGKLDRLQRRRRHMAGPAGCGLCGLESLEAAIGPLLPKLPPGHRVDARAISDAMGSMRPAQRLGNITRATHAAGFYRPGDGLIALREDVGRHNALDKLAGALAREGVDAASGVLVLTSRVSVELVQKAHRMGAAVLAAISAPTSLAIQTASDAGITLVAVARDDGFELFTHPERIRAG